MCQIISATGQQYPVQPRVQESRVAMSEPFLYFCLHTVLLARTPFASYAISGRKEGFEKEEGSQFLFCP